jgi:transcriptional regulator with XRE-family HTH domain
VKHISHKIFTYLNICSVSRGDQKFRVALGKKLKAFRKQQNISQAQLAFECNITRELLSKIEGGKINTTLKTLLALSEALNQHCRDLFDFEY